jgi:hypothetical protein
MDVKHSSQIKGRSLVLGRIYGTSRWGLMKVLERKHHNLYSSSNTVMVTKSRRMRCMRHVACMEEIRSAYKVLIGKPEGSRHFRRLCQDNIKMCLK